MEVIVPFLLGFSLGTVSYKLWVLRGVRKYRREHKASKAA